MSLEMEAWKARGGFGPRPRTSRPPTAGDRVARVAAVLILVGIFTFSVWALRFVAFAVELLFAIFILALVHVGFRVREVRNELAEARAELADLRRRVEEGRGPPPPPPPTGGGA